MELTTRAALIKEITLENFRNYASAEITLECGQNVFVGRNGQGKSNILEAIYALSSTRSFRGARDKDLIRHGEELARTTGIVGDDDTEISLEYSSTGGKKASVFGQKLTRALDLVGRLPAIVFSTADLAIVDDGPSARRAFLDTELSLLSPSYLVAFAGYRKALEQRNAALRNVRDGASEETLAPWEVALAERGALIRAAREDWLKDLVQIASREHANLSGVNEELDIEPVVTDGEKSSDALLALLQRERRRDLAVGHTTIGPHRDDLKIALNGEDARAFASQGQRRTIALAMKLAVAHYWRERQGTMPLILLDDILSDLDSDRRHAVMDLSGSMGQVVITTTDLDALKPEVRSDARVFEVRNGTVLQ